MNSVFSVVNKLMLAAWLLLPLVVQADASARMSAFFQSTTSMRAQFHQTVLDAQNRKVQEVTGSMQLLRPGKFRWDYNKPYVQLVIGDGQKVWLYDPELNQVTVRTLDKMIGSSPAALLAGSRDIEKTFDVRADVRQDQLDWIEVTPKDHDSGFERMYLGFKGENLQEMELHDNFGQTTVIEFSRLEKNPKLNPQAFKFSPPKGADVVGDELMAAGDLFVGKEPHAPLAERLRPKTLDDVVGQSHLLGAGRPLRLAFSSGRLPSMILWGPPGVGKTTLARLIANNSDAEFIPLSAVLSGVKDIREAVERAEMTLQQSGRRTILFVDEVHRFNKSQQDAFLPFVESGLFTFIGATTENPSFEVNSALLSRAQVFVLEALSAEELAVLLQRALELASDGLTIEADAQEQILSYADGDARRLLNFLEGLFNAAEAAGRSAIDLDFLKSAMATRMRRFDKGGEAFYDQISALHKSVRGSNPDAALYWFLRMLDGGADPLYLARRIVRMAIEDIGLADPRAQEITASACEIYERLGSPEGELALSNAVIYLAVAPKSNAAYMAYNQMKALVAQDQSRNVPIHLRNAPTKLMKELGYGHAYRYAHDEPEAYAAGEQYFPDGMNPVRVYEPTTRGLEGKIGEKLAHLRELDRKAKK